MINLDTNTAIAFIAENSPLRSELKQYVAGRELVMAQVAVEEFNAIVRYSAGVKEKVRALCFLQRVRVVPNITVYGCSIFTSNTTVRRK